ncbi:MAG: DUF6165 family protein [Cyanobium sp.]
MSLNVHAFRCHHPVGLVRAGRGPGSGAPSAFLACRHASVSDVHLWVGDKLTILTLKQQHFQGEAQEHVSREQALLLQVFQPLAPRMPGPLHLELQQVNGELWEVEEAIRTCDRRGDFGDSFVELARRVYQLNDCRAALKRAINLASGSDLVEQKSYANLPPAHHSP